MSADEEDDGSDERGAPYRRASPEEQAMVRALATALRLSRLHALDNVVSVDAQRELETTLGGCLARSEKVMVVGGDDRIGVNGAAIRLKRQGRTWGHEFLEFLEKMGIGGFTFSGSWDANAIRSLLTVFANLTATEAEDRARELAAGAETISEPAHVEVLGRTPGEARRGGDGEEELAEWQRAAFYYARLIAIAESTYEGVAAGKSPDAFGRELRHTLIKVLERLRGLDFTIRLLALTVLPYPAGHALAGHSVDVAILSILMGRLLRLPRGVLADLGYAAFFHDLGRSPQGWPQAEDGSEDNAVRQNHPARGVALALAGTDTGDAGLWRVVVALEHHRMPDGFPRDRSFQEHPHLFARIVSIADAFDRLEKGSPQTPALSPFAALSQIQAQRWRFEETLTGLLHDVLGKWPRGTLVRLKEGSIGVVIDGGARWGDRPIVRRLLLPDGSADPSRKTAELATPDMVAGIVDPSEVPSLDWRRAVLA